MTLSAIFTTLVFFGRIFCQLVIYRKPQQNVFSREITKTPIFTKITIFCFKNVKKHAVIVKNRIRVSFIISGLIFWSVLIQSSKSSSRIVQGAKNQIGLELSEFLQKLSFSRIRQVKSVSNWEKGGFLSKTTIFWLVDLIARQFQIVAIQ